MKHSELRLTPLIITELINNPFKPIEIKLNSFNMSIRFSFPKLNVYLKNIPITLPVSFTLF